MHMRVYAYKYHGVFFLWDCLPQCLDDTLVVLKFMLSIFVHISIYIYTCVYTCGEIYLLIYYMYIDIN